MNCSPCIVAACIAALPSAAASGQCSFAWSQDFVSTGVDQRFYAAIEFDDGTGPALYVAGPRWADGVALNGVGKWDGVAWHPLGVGVSGGGNFPSASALAVFDDGSGPALYAAGAFTQAGGQPANRIARWDGSAWSPLGTGVEGGASPRISALTVYDLGNGPRLLAGGVFDTAGGAPASNIAAWDGVAWTPIGAGLNNGASEMHAFALPDGSNALFVIGSFTASGSLPANRLAYWADGAWHSPNLPFTIGTYSFPFVSSLAVYQGVLYVGGDFHVSLPQPARNLIRFDGTTWMPVQRPAEFQNGFVTDMLTFDDGEDEVLYATGLYGSPVAAQHAITRWDGQTWTALGGPLRFDASDLTTTFLPSASDLARFDDGGGPRLYVAGSFALANGRQTNHIARLIDDLLAPLHPGTAIIGEVQALAAFDDGGGPAVFASGALTAAGDVSCRGLARWDGQVWSPLQGGVATFPYGPPRVPSLYPFDAGSGEALYIGGSFRTINGMFEESFARWDGQTLAPIPDFPSPLGTDYRIEAMTSFQDSPGSGALILGGRFQDFSREIQNLAVYDGNYIFAFFHAEPDQPIYALLTDYFDPGALYAAGEFTNIGGESAAYVAHYSGGTWTSLGNGLPGPVYALAQRPAQSAIFAGGTFGVARWSSGTWTMLTGLPPGTVHSLAYFDDGSGSALYAGGAFDGLIRKRSGQQWLTVDDGLAGTAVYALLAADGPDGPALYAGGAFRRAGSVGVSGIARYAPAGPNISQPPAYQTLPRGESANFSIAASGNGTIAYQWRFESQPLIDGGTISGATSPALTIASVRRADAGRYDVVLTDGCGRRISPPALLRVTFTCATDLDSDGSTGLADLAQLLSSFGSANPQPTDGDIDEDGDVDLADLATLLASFGTVCP